MNLKGVNVMAEIKNLPAYEAKSFARWVAEATEKYFENPEVKKRFEEWKKEQELNAHRTALQQCG